MRSWGDEDELRGPTWPRPKWARPSRPPRTLRLFGWELRRLRPTERATRDLLGEIYRVPPDRLDEVLEARLAELDR